MVILVVFGDFSVFSVIFVVHICHICCHICIIFVILFHATSAIFVPHRQFFTQILFTAGGNFGPNCHKRHAHLVVKNGFLGKNSYFLAQILIFRKNFFGRLCPRAFLVISICHKIV